MIRYFCDRCTIEVPSQHALFKVTLEARAVDAIEFEVCNDCRAAITEEIRRYNKGLKDAQ